MIAARVRPAAVRLARTGARRLGARRLVLAAHARLSDTDPSDTGPVGAPAPGPPYADASPLAEAVDVNEWMAFRGHLFADLTAPLAIAGSPVVAVAVCFATEAWERPATGGERLAWFTPMPASQSDWHIGLGLRCADGRRYLVEDPASVVLERHHFGAPHVRYVQEVEALQEGLVLEIGSRARSGRTYPQLAPDHLRYLGMDIVAGPNVDLVGDAHELSSLVEPESVDAIFSIATFEHLAMPWRAVVELNRVLKPGGVCYILSHQTFPLHEVPWDFFRFSDSGWRALFNEATGFEILEVAMGEPAAVAGLALTGITWNMDRASAFLGSAVTCRKIGPATVDWPVPMRTIERSVYPGANPDPT